MNSLPTLNYLARIMVDDTGWVEVRTGHGIPTGYERVVKFNRELEDVELKEATSWVRADMCFGAIDVTLWPTVTVTKDTSKTAAWKFEISMDPSWVA